MICVQITAFFQTAPRSEDLFGQFVEVVVARIGVIARCIAHRDPEGHIVRIEPEGRLGQEGLAGLLPLEGGAPPDGVQKDPDGVGGLHRDLSVLDPKIGDRRTARGVAVPVLDPVHQVFVGERIRLHHRPGKAAVVSRVVVVARDAADPFARPHHLLIDVGNVVHIAVDMRPAVDDLKGGQIIQFAVEVEIVHRPVRVIEDHQHIPFARRADHLVHAVERVFADVVGIADVFGFVEVLFRVSPDVVQVAADHPDIVRILGEEVHVHLLSPVVATMSSSLKSPFSPKR